MKTVKKSTKQTAIKTPTGKKRGRHAKVKVELQTAHVVIILDESGSMAQTRDVTIRGVNEQIQKIKESGKSDKVKTFVSFVTFNSRGQTKFRIFNQAVENLNEITEKDYVPNGSTAIYDAVGEAVDKYITETKHDDKDTTYLFVIVSDGEENSSGTYTAKLIAEKIQELQKNGRWTFTYMGSNQDLSKVSADMGIPLSNMAMYSSSVAGTTRGMTLNSAAIDGYMQTRSKGVVPVASSFYNSDNKVADFTEDALTPLDLSKITLKDDSKI